MGKGLPDYRILGWESKEAQNLRFDAMISNIPLGGMKLLDVGCGTGNLLEYLNTKNIKVDYTGVDILKSMIDCAKEKGLDAQFYNMDIFCGNPFQGGSFDVVYASGIFNLDLGNNREFLLKALRLFCRLSRRYVAFNLLHCASCDKEDKYCYFEPDAVLKTLERELPGELSGIRIIEGYLQNDFTVICRKK